MREISHYSLLNLGDDSEIVNLNECTLGCTIKFYSQLNFFPYFFIQTVNYLQTLTHKFLHSLSIFSIR